MVNMAQLPTWFELVYPYFLSEQGCKNEIRCTQDDTIFYFSKSCYSLGIIVEAYKRVLNKEKITIWVPIYLCGEAIAWLHNDSVCIKFYKQSCNLQAVLDSLKELAREGIPDLLLLVHYFGLENNDQPLIKFCKDNGIQILEDGAHVLMPTGNIGKYGIASFYSPHKTLPVPQGSMLIIKNGQDSIISEINKIKEEYSDIAIKEREYLWIFKIVVQKILPQNINKLFSFNADKIKENENLNDERVEDFVALSKYSLKAIQMFSHQKLINISQIRRKNYTFVHDLLLRYYLCKNIATLDESSIPLYLYCEFECESEANRAEADFNHYGTFCVTWPTFHTEITKEEIQMWKKCRAFTVHSQLPLERIKLFIENKNNRRETDAKNH